MSNCTYLHNKLVYEEAKLAELCPDKSQRADFVLNGRESELCGYCLTICPDRFECNKYGKDAR